MRIDNFIGGIGFNRFHEFAVNSDGNIEVFHRFVFGLHVYEFFYFRMPIRKNSHISASSGSALFNDIGHFVKKLHEG